MNRQIYIFFSIISILIITSNKVNAQLSGSNIAEYQMGNIPDVGKGDESSLYDQLNLKYRYKNLTLFTRSELYQPSFGEDNSYLRLSQYRASYKYKELSVEVGQLYNSFGRGLLMRNYEIPSSVFEDKGYRIRYGYYKDLHGFSAKYKLKYLNVKVVRGEILTVDLPPTFNEKERRPDLVEGVEIEGNILGHSLGVIAMRHHANEKTSNYASVFYNKSLESFSIYGELAKKVDSISDFYEFKKVNAYGGYLGANYSKSNFGFSIEYKNYHNFAIGNGVNNPPSLIREQSSPLLNRSTHIPLLLSESGYQVEFYFNFNDNHTFTFNHALSENHLATNSFLFQEYYLEYSLTLNSNISVKSFFDYSIDPLKNEPQRFTGGTQWDINHSKYNSGLNIEIQTIERELSDKYNLTNFYLAYTLSKANKFSISTVFEFSNDPFLFNENEEKVIYPSVLGTYKINNKNKLTVFAGKRRGGPACNSGVCYDVLDFEGIELRLNTRF